MDAGSDESGRRIAEGIEHLTLTRDWPWHQPGVQSVGLDEDDRATCYLATDSGFVVLGSVES